MPDQRPPDDTPEPQPTDGPEKRRDIAREDADSPHAIPLAPPQGDGS